MMKKYLQFAFVLISINVFGQVDTKAVKVIEVPFDKRITLIFPSPIVEDVLGSDQVDPVKKDNKYFLSAISQKGFPETSLYIELSSGHYYDFVIRYNNTIKSAVTVFTLDDASGKIAGTNPKIADPKTTKTEKGTPDGVPPLIITDAQTVYDTPEHTTDIAVVGRKLLFYLEEVYIKDDKYYFKISMYNQSNVTYDIQSINFKIQPKTVILKKNAIEAQEVLPVYVFNDDKITIERKHKLSKVFVFDKFTISDKKKFVVEIWEKGGDRELAFDISGENLLNAKPLK